MMLTEVLFGLSVLAFLAGTHLLAYSIGYKYGSKQNKEEE